MRLVIAEDSALFRDGLARLLADAGHDIVAAVPDAVAALAAIRAHAPDLAILDIRMPPDCSDDGARLAVTARVVFPHMGLVLLSQHVQARLSAELVGAGSFAYLLKDRVLDMDEFLDVLERVRAGGSALDPEVVARLLGARRADSRLALLTPREHQVIALMAEGLTNTGIAHRMWLTPRTVETHVGNILAKLELPLGTDDHRRVLAVIAYLDTHGADHA